MLVSNRTFFLFWRVILVLLLVLLVIDLTFALIPGSMSDLFTKHYLTYASGLAIVLLAVLRFSYISYEDEYEIIHLNTQSLVFGPFETHKHKHYEFPKNILVNWELRSGFLKRELVLTVASSSGHEKTRRFDLLFLGKKEREYIIERLSEIRQANRKNKGRKKRGE